jgi:dCTP deaminase
MILSGEEIRTRLGSDVCICPFADEHCNPNSYDLTLHNELLVYEEVVLDLKEPNRFRRLSIPEDGLILSPGQLYLGRTVEYTETHRLVPMISGRSSLSRLGLFVHGSGGFGSIGYRGHWTIELYTIQPIRIYPGVKICQIAYQEIVGNVRECCSSKYQNSLDIQPSLMFREFSGRREYEQLQLDFDTLAASCVEQCVEQCVSQSTGEHSGEEPSHYV